jgi:predicted sugar kinase
MNLEIFDAGKIFNLHLRKIKKARLKYSNVGVTVPARLNSMCFDLKSLTNPEKKFVYNSGELAFSVNLETYCKIKILKDGKKEVKISKNTKRKSIVKHAALIMQKILSITDSIIVEANNIQDYPHAGLGSSSSLITTVCIAINEAYGNPIKKRDLVLIISQNHGEEISNNNDQLIHVQCNGGSPSVALLKGGIQIICGETQPVLKRKFPKGYYFVFGIPKFYKRHDAKDLMEIEEKQFPRMLKSSEDFSREIAWKVLHELLPAIDRNDLLKVGEIIEFYRFKTGSLMTDSQTWPELYNTLKELVRFRDEITPIISVSSCGPAIYAVTKDPAKIEKIFQERDMKCFKANPENRGYRILNRSN